MTALATNVLRQAARQAGISVGLLFHFHRTVREPPLDPAPRTRHLQQAIDYIATKLAVVSAPAAPTRPTPLHQRTHSKTDAALPTPQRPKLHQYCTQCKRGRRRQPCSICKRACILEHQQAPRDQEATPPFSASAVPPRRQQKLVICFALLGYNRAASNTHLFMRTSAHVQASALWLVTLQARNAVVRTPAAPVCTTGHYRVLNQRTSTWLFAVSLCGIAAMLGRRRHYRDT